MDVINDQLNANLIWVGQRGDDVIDLGNRAGINGISCSNYSNRLRELEGNTSLRVQSTEKKKGSE